ncbi:S9 family peptidase [Lacticigenium naphthae]|uniref:S9 family peptidase n=1 Tax=Lacticigenium naphthae TaxID=515351 RepID=UPI000404A3FC|nr:S9 family peptidase [Lacticigenium naphthae]
MGAVTKEDLMELKNISQPVSGDKEIFYLETQINQEKNRYETKIFSLNKQTKKRKEWGDSGSVNTAIQLSPNKKWLAFLSNEKTEKKMQLKVMSVEGGKAFSLTDEEEGVQSFKWTPNSSSIYFQTSKSTKNKEKDSEKKELPEPAIYDEVTYKLDGQGILDREKVFQLKKIMLSTKSSELIYETEKSVQLNYVGKDESFVIISDERNKEDEWDFGGTVYWLDTETKKQRSLSESIPHGEFSYGAMNASEDYLLLAGHDYTYGFVTQTKIYGYNLQTNQLSCLTTELDREIGDVLVGDFQQQTKGVEIEWLTDKTYLYPVSHQGKLQLYKGEIQGAQELLFDEPVHLTDASLDRNSMKLVVGYSTFSNPSELAEIDLANPIMRSLYNPNEEYMASHQLVEPERFWFKGADDWDIEGWYLSPVDDTKKHPAILYIHGGPQVAYGETFFHEMQTLVHKGYGVIMINPRGGNSYGQEFVASILNAYGDKDYEDLMLGTDAVLADHSNIDREKLFVTGGSYGGFMTNWIVGHTNRFRAAVTQRSISNWISFYGTSDIGPFFVPYQLGADLTDTDALWKMSPLAYAQDATTPLLLIHGQEDLRCPLEQGEQFYIAMKRQKIETKMMTFPKSSHGLSRNGLPNLRMKRLEAIEQWFSEHGDTK